MIALRCDASTGCTAPAVTLIIIADDGAHGLCSQHDAAVRAMSLQHLPDEAPKHIVIDLPEVVR